MSRSPNTNRRPLLLLFTLALLLCALPAGAQDHGGHGDHGDTTHAAGTAAAAEHGDAHGEGHGDAHADHGGGHASPVGLLPLWTVIPFAGILLSIALFPLVAPHFWHPHFPKVSAFWALLFAVPFLIWNPAEAVQEILHIYLIDYIPFIILLWGLFTISGGIYVGGALRGKPVVNLVLLLIGTFLASLIGTTGAAMVLIRPLLRANEWRRNKVHLIVFFIFLVANIGGSLTPLGDPPLFLGFLHGVPFFWVTTGLLPEMLLTVGADPGRSSSPSTPTSTAGRTRRQTPAAEGERHPHRGLAQPLLPAGRHGRRDHVRLGPSWAR